MHLDDVLTELVEHSGDRLLRVAYQLTHDAAAAQDLVQEALLRVYRSVRRRGLAPEDWYAYLRRAVINEYVRSLGIPPQDLVVLSPDEGSIKKALMHQKKLGGAIAIVDFWDQRDLPRWFARSLRAWLALFDVHPRPELIDELRNERGIAVSLSPLYRGYAAELRCVKLA